MLLSSCLWITQQICKSTLSSYLNSHNIRNKNQLSSWLITQRYRNDGLYKHWKRTFWFCMMCSELFRWHIPVCYIQPKINFSKGAFCLKTYFSAPIHSFFVMSVYLLVCLHVFIKIGESWKVKRSYCGMYI